MDKKWITSGIRIISPSRIGAGSGDAPVFINSGWGDIKPEKGEVGL